MMVSQRKRNYLLFRSSFGLALFLSINFSFRYAGMVSNSGRISEESSSSAIRIQPSTESQPDPLANMSRTALSLPFCTTNQIIKGKWVRTWLPSAPYISSLSHLRCFPDEHYTQTPFPTWYWFPQDASDNRCFWQQWNSSEFRRLAARATISIIGDSLSWEQFSSLLQLLGERGVKQKPQHWSKSHNTNYVHPIGTMRLVFRNDKHLQFISHSVEENFPIVLVLNRGAHYVNDTVLAVGMEKTIGDLQKWYAECGRYKLTCHLIWRTSVPGHPHCKNDTIPAKSIVQMETLIQNSSNYDNRTINYHWQDYQRQNKLMVKWLEDSGIEFSLMDAYSVNILRPDEHRTISNDCLHNCYPGKMDLYNQWMLHLLREHRKPKDILHLEELYRKYVGADGENRS